MNLKLNLFFKKYCKIKKLDTLISFLFRIKKYILKDIQLSS
jgi:hypothetical protein